MEDLKTFAPTDEELTSYAYADIQTNKGNIRVTLFGKEAPQAVTNFATLATSNFYDGLTFHRVISGFVAQGGCPKGDGTGGPGYRIHCEVAKNPHRHKRGALSMAHAGRNTGGSQFFLCFVDLPHLDGEHTVFGQIEDKQSLMILDALEQNDTIMHIKILPKEV